MMERALFVALIVIAILAMSCAEARVPSGCVDSGGTGCTHAFTHILESTKGQLTAGRWHTRDATLLGQPITCSCRDVLSNPCELRLNP